MSILPTEYYQQEDVLFLSRDLLGKYLITKVEDVITGGMIIETEAYKAPEDRASHAYNNKKTKRNSIMFASGGVSYVYLCYGIHALFNIVTNKQDIPHAILIRAIEPRIGVQEMLYRRRKPTLDPTLTTGPGALSQALGITTKHNGLPLTTKPIWLEDRGVVVTEEKIITGQRVGIDYAGEDAKLPWRFQFKREKEKL